MKKLFYLIVFLGFISCESTSKSDSTRISLDDKKFLSKFKDISFDTLKVYSPENSASEFIGVELDSLDAILFPKEIAHWHFMDPPGLYAVYKFPIDSQTIGLIARTPSEYSASSVKFFFYDTMEKKITSYFELAENIGDAGTLMVKNSYLFKERSKSLKALISVGDFYDNSVDDEKDTTIEEYYSYCLISLSKQRVDTITRDKERLKKEFKHIIK